MTAPTISVTEFSKLDASATADLIDVRTPLEFREVHAANAKNVPLDQLDPKLFRTGENSGSKKVVYVICKGGTRGAKAQEQLLEAGCENIVNVEGGTDAWVAAGLPVVRGKKAISLERQVRITAGAISFGGALATLITGNPYFAGIPAFIGAGLVFAGVTDSCAMGMLIAKMPWNR